MAFCEEHNEHIQRISTNEERTRNNERNIIEIWKAINQMKSWVIAGMGSLILAAIVFIVDVTS